MPDLTRRRFLGTAAATAGAGAAMGVLPRSVQQALATTPTRRPRLRDIEHVVLLMQENRSFDHYYGTLSGVAGFDDRDAIRLATGRDVFHQPDAVNPDGYLLPFHLDTEHTSAQAIPSTSHAWAVQHAAWNGGRMDNWLPAHRAADKANGPYVMGYYERDDIPFQFALADAFTICDHYHCSVMGPTWPNRLFWMSGTNDPNGDAGGPILANTLPHGPYTWTTYAERLQRAGVSWQVYGDEAGMKAYNMLPNFRAFQQAAPGTPLYDRGVKAVDPGQFAYDAAHDRLPTVSWLVPGHGQSEHPAELPAAGADFVARQIAAIAANRDVWAKTLFVLDYDENDGLFDHVVPPTPRPGTPDEFVDGLPVGGGFRVPCILVSPWTAGGWVASEPFDHTSVLQLLEQVTGVREPNISAWRRRTFGDLTSALRLRDATRRPPRLPDTAAQLAKAQDEVATSPAPELPGARQRRPHQERGHRPHV
ncbi:phospholipase C [Jatrophihabitans endophyticus]|uniref:phospholipase C n=1 Tax=Jatrophihabitans endophyticus TaxID=1206085 RepID=A0A1M5R304_9ACTN|nr:alkaline phosphatase family protein [Jatrophihabitans endophyticus]SHH20754.1 phospholipase C [Jatrophihabitans endophyticus]